MKKSLTDQIMEKYLNKIIVIREKLFLQDDTISSKIIDDASSGLLNLTLGSGFDDLSFYTKQLDTIKNELLIEYFVNLIKENNIHNLKIIKNTPILSFLQFHNNKSYLYYFKNYGLPSELDNCILSQLISKFSVSKVHLISLTSGNPKSYLFNDTSLSDPISELELETFFKNIFNENEYNDFISFTCEFTAKVNSINSISIIKPLTNTTKYHFIKNINSFLLSDKFKNIIKEDSITLVDKSASLTLINENFFKKERYRSITRKSSYSDSLITAEWMYESLKKVNNIDYTVISLGYFKSLEQFLCELVKSHRNEDKKIKRMTYKELYKLPHKIYLNDSAIKKEYLNFMLDSLITFINDYPDMFMSNIDKVTLEHITFLLNKAKKIRNGYFHKDNMTNWDVVVESRKVTYLTIYYLLGSINIDEKQINALNIPTLEVSNFTKICDFIHYSTSYIYRIKTNKEYYLAAASTDNSRQIDDNNEPVYSGLFVNKYLTIPVETNEITLDMCTKNKLEKIKLDLNDPTLTIEVCKFTPFEKGFQLIKPYKTIYKNLKYYSDN